MKIIISEEEITQIIEAKLVERFNLDADTGGELMIKPGPDNGCSVIFQAEIPA